MSCKGQMVHVMEPSPCTDEHGAEFSISPGPCQGALQVQAGSYGDDAPACAALAEEPRDGLPAGSLAERPPLGWWPRDDIRVLHDSLLKQLLQLLVCHVAEACLHGSFGRWTEGQHPPEVWELQTYMLYDLEQGTLGACSGITCSRQGLSVLKGIVWLCQRPRSCMDRERNL